MRIYVSADLEGVSGVVHGEHTRRDGREHDRARRWMTDEVNAAVEGALNAGAREVVVNDSHGTMRNLILEDLHQGARLITGSPKPMGMLEGLTEDFDGAFFIGYHARVGSGGVLNHTYSGAVVADLRVNGRPVGEPGMNGMVSNHMGVPVALVTGDSVVAQHAKEMFGDIITVVTKRAVGRYAADCLPPNIACTKIKEGASGAVELLKRGDMKVMDSSSPLEVELRFVNTGMADMAQLFPNSKRISPSTLKLVVDNPLEAYKAVSAMIQLAYAATR